MPFNIKRSWIIWGAILAGALTMLYVLQMANAPNMKWTMSDLSRAVMAGDVKEIRISGDESRAVVTLDDDTEKIVLKERGVNSFLDQLALTSQDLSDNGVAYSVEKSNSLAGLAPLLGTVVPFVLMIGFLMFMMRQAQAGNNQALSFGRSRARLMAGDTPTVTFDDVAGVEEAKAELQEVVEFLREPEKFIALGAKIPKGVLMMGPPGCGKTLMARAVAGEAGVPFFSISGSEFVEMFVGVGASRVRDLFDQAKKHSPCIVFMDEIDAVGRQRGAGLGGSHDEREQTLNQILVEMDGFDTDTNVIVVAATNRPDILDPALLRPGRFDRRVIIDRPDMRGRRAILAIHTNGKPLASDIDLDVIARRTPGFSGADLENLVNEAAILAARRNGRSIRQADMEEAADKVRFGPERRSRMLTDRELEFTAYHESGHAVVMHLIPECDPVHKITIIPRGMSGGMTSVLPEDDKYLRDTAKFQADLAAALGGRAAEEIVFGDVSTGASSDLEYATRTARDMVTRYGMSEALGPITYGEKNELVFLGRELSEQRNYSEKIARQIDAEVRRIVNESHERARSLLQENLHLLHAVAKRLLEVETLEREEFEAIMAGVGGQEQAAPGGEPGQSPSAGPAPEVSGEPEAGLDASPEADTDGGTSAEGPLSPGVAPAS
jgi:cell division protease FtsH